MMLWAYGLACLAVFLAPFFRGFANRSAQAIDAGRLWPALLWLGAAVLAGGGALWSLLMSVRAVLGGG